MAVETGGWTSIGKTDNAEVFEIAPHVLAVVPCERSVDTAETARQNIRIQLEHLRARGRRAGVVVFMDQVLDQDAGARAVYRELPDPAFQLCFALVGGTPFGRAVGSVFLGLSRPRIPTRMFATLDEALSWIGTIRPAA